MDDFIVTRIIGFCYHKSRQLVCRQWQRAVINFADTTKYMPATRMPLVWFRRHQYELDWYSITHKCRLKREIIQEFKKLIPNFWLLRYQEMDDEFIAERFREYPNENVSYYKVSDGFIISNPQMIDWKILSLRNNLSLDIIHNHWRLVDWHSVCKNTKMSSEILNQYSDYLHWKSVSKYQVLSQNFMIRNYKRLQMGRISKHQKLKRHFIYRFRRHLDWKKISEYQTLDEKFICQLRKFVHWRNISKYQILSEHFIAKFSDKVDWNQIILKQKVSRELMEKYTKSENWQYYVQKGLPIPEWVIDSFGVDLDWRMITRRNRFTVNQIREFQNLINWEVLSTRDDLSMETLLEFRDRIDWYNFFGHHSVTIDIIDNFADKIPWSDISYYIFTNSMIEKYFQHIDWQQLSKTCGCNVVPSLIKYSHLINWNSVPIHNFSMTEIELLADKLKWFKISRYGYINEKTIEMFADRFDWSQLSLRQMPENFITKWESRIVWDNLPCKYLSELLILRNAYRLNWTPDTNTKWSGEFTRRYLAKKISLKNL